MSNRGARFQRGTLVKSGDDWKVRIRRDHAREDGSIQRREISIHVASCSAVRTRTQARTLANAIVDKETGRGLTAGVSMLAADYLRRYIVEHLVSKKPASQSTIKGRIERHLIPGVARLRIEQVTHRTAQHIVAGMLKAKLHSTTIRDTIYLLATIMKHAQQDGLACQRIDVRSVSMPSKVEADVERQAFTEAEVVRLLANARMPWRLAFALQATLGLRCAEVLGLAWRDFEGSSVVIRRSAVLGRIQSLKSRTSAKRLAAPAALSSLLEQHRATWSPNADDLLFATRNKRPVYGTWYRGQLARECERLGIPNKGTHAFRHFAATHLMRSGKSAAATRDHLRHSNVSITNTYAHSVGGDLKEAADLLGAVITKSMQGVAQVADVCESPARSEA